MVNLIVILQLIVLIFIVIHIYYFFKRKELDTSIKQVVGKYSLVIAASNEENLIAQCLQEILDQECRFLDEIVVVINNSKDHTSEIVESFEKIDSRIKHISIDKFIGKSSAVILGLKSIKNEYAFIMDADTVLLPNALENLASYRETQDSDFVIGIILYKKQNGLQSKILEFERYYANNYLQSARGHAGTATLHGSFSLINKTVYLKYQKDRVLQDDLYVTYLFVANNYNIDIIDLVVAEEEDRTKFSLFIFQRARWIIGNILILKLFFTSVYNAPSIIKSLLLLSYPILWYFIYYVIVLGYLFAYQSPLLLITTLILHVTYFSTVLLGSFQRRGITLANLVWSIIYSIIFPVLILLSTIVAFITLILKANTFERIFFKRN